MNATTAQCLDKRIPQRAVGVATLAALVWYFTFIRNQNPLSNFQRKINDYNHSLLSKGISFALIAAGFLYVYEPEITLTTQWTKERLHALHAFLLGDDDLATMADD